MIEFGIFDHLDRNAVKLTEYYEGRLRLVEAYDRHGFYCYHVAEHHSTPLGMAPSPGVYLSAVAQRTQRLRFGPLVYLLPFYHPLRLIEEICMLDQMSGGRMQLGVGRGISPIEGRYYGLDPAEGQARFDETLAVVLQGLQGGTLDFSGRYHRIDQVPMELEPVQKPHPPLWIGVQSEASAERAGARGANVVSLLPAAALRAVTDAYWRGLGNAAAGGVHRIGASLFIVVGDSDEAGMALAEQAYQGWRRSFNYLYALHNRGPVLGEQPGTFKEVMDAGRGVAGSAATVSEFLRRFIATSGVNYIVGQFAFGDLGTEDTLRSIERFGREVMPAVRDFVPEGATAG